MTLHERVRSIVEALPDSGTVSLPVSELRAWLEEDGAGSPHYTDGTVVTDLTVEDIGKELGRTAACVRGWCRSKKLAGAYRLNGREWRIPRAAFQSFLAAQATGTSEHRPTRTAKGVDLGAWRRTA